MPKTNAERVREHRARKRAASSKTKKTPLTSTERVRRYREKQKTLQLTSGVKNDEQQTIVESDFLCTQTNVDHVQEQTARKQAAENQTKKTAESNKILSTPSLTLELDYNFFKKLLNYDECEDESVENIVEEHDTHIKKSKEENNVDKDVQMKAKKEDSNTQIKEEKEDIEVENLNQVKAGREDSVEENDFNIKVEGEDSDEENDFEIKIEREDSLEQNYFQIKIGREDSEEESDFRIKEEKSSSEEGSIIDVKDNTGVSEENYFHFKLGEDVTKMKQIKLNKTSMDKIPSTVVSESLPNNDCTASGVNSQIQRTSVRCIPNDEICESESTVTLDNNLQSNNISSEDNIETQNRIFPKNNTNTKDIKLICHICQHIYNSFSDLSMHLRTHIGERRYACHLCDYRTTQVEHLIKHLKCEHPNDSSYYSCHICQYKCVGKDALNIHLHEHAEEKPNDFCDFRSTIKADVHSSSANKHTEENFSCYICECEFATKKQLRMHFNIHTRWKPYKCDLCSYKCGSKIYLANHMKYRHTVEKNFSCYKCPRKFKTQNGLKIHFHLKHIRTLSTHS